MKSKRADQPLTAEQPVNSETTVAGQSSAELEHDDPWNFFSEEDIQFHKKNSQENDLCKSQPKGFRLYNPNHCLSIMSNSITYGDFDGDLKSDSFAILRNTKTKKLSPYIWFGGETSPSSLDLFQNIRVDGKNFDDFEMNSFFDRQSNKKDIGFKLGKSLNHPVELEYFAASGGVTGGRFPLLLLPREQFRKNRIEDALKNRRKQSKLNCIRIYYITKTFQFEYFHRSYAGVSIAPNENRLHIG